MLLVPVVAGCSSGSRKPSHATTRTPSTTLPSGRPRGSAAAWAPAWPQYGRIPTRTGVAERSAVLPPFRVRWTLGAGSYVEFPPVIAGERLYVGTDLGRILAVDVATGRVKWMRETGRCIAASAATRGGLVYFALMDPPPCGDEPTSGRMFAVRARTGRTVWSVHAGVMESSPLVVGRTVYVGSWDGRLYAFDANSGRSRWTFKTGGKVKGGAAYAGGTVYVGSYDGRIYALAASTGKLRWVADVGAPVYATPAVAKEAVIVGTLGGTVYALDASTGHTNWIRPTGSYVYSSPAIWHGTAYVGSYDRHLYALDVSSGAVRWSFDAGAPVSGTPTVVNGVVYFSRCLGCIAGVGLHLPRRTFGLDAQSGKRVWTFPDGEYTPLVADRQRAYLVGYTRLYGLGAHGG
jgi:outer membrane protein assembly factor BamB